MSIAIPVSAKIPSNGELALLGTALGDCRGEQQYRSCNDCGINSGTSSGTKKPRPLFTDDTHKAAAIFAFFSDPNPRRKEDAAVRLARFQCFFAFPENQRFGLDMSGPSSVNLPGYGPDHARLLKELFQQFQRNQLLTTDDVFQRSGSNIRLRGSGRNTGSWSNGGCMVALLDRYPGLSDNQFVDRVTETVRVSHNHPHAIASAVAVALAARSAIECRQSAQSERMTDRSFAETTISRIRRHVNDRHFLDCLDIVQRELGSHSHDRVMVLLNEQLPVTTSNRRSGIRGDRRLRDTWAPNTAAAVLHFLFAETNSQQALLSLVEQHTNDQDTVGAMLMALSVLREGGFRRNEFAAGELQELLDLFPPWVRINRQARDYLTADEPSDPACQCLDAATAAE